MNQNEKILIYEKIAENFSIRFWKIFAPNFLMYLISLVLFLYFNWKNDSIITKMCILLVLTFIVIRLYNSFKWSKNKILSIEFYADNYEFEILEKDTKKRIQISKDNLFETLKWKGGRPKILVLSIFDNENKIFEIYSGGRKDNEYELEDITYKLKKHKNASR